MSGADGTRGEADRVAQFTAFLSLAQYVSKRKLTDKVIARLRKEYDDAMAEPSTIVAVRHSS